MSPDRGTAAVGFTLVEVLVALAIVAFGLIAVFGQLNQSAAAAARLRDKTFAHWIAMNLLTERRVRDKFPGIGTESDDIEMANAHWHWEVKYSDEAIQGFQIEGVRRADVTVAFADAPDRPVATAVGYIVQHTTAQGSPGASTGWPPWNAGGEPGGLDEQNQKPPPGPAPGGAEP